MKKTYFCKIAAAMISICLLFCASGCKSGLQSSDDLPVLTVWVLSDEYKSEIERSFNGDFTSINWRLDVVTVETSEIEKKLEDTRESGIGQPDVFMLSPDILGKYVYSDIAADLGKLGFTLSDSSYYPYTISAGTDLNGSLKAVCYQPDPGLFFYRRSMAKVYLGTDDPEEIQPLLSDWDKFLDTAKSVYSASSGKTSMIVGVEGIMMAYMSGDEEGWITDSGKFKPSAKAKEFMQYAAELDSAGVIYDAQQWSHAWTAGISDTQSVFGYFSSGLGMKNVLKKACGGTVKGDGSYGDWACVAGPNPYNWGGCWFAIRRGSEMTAQAASFLRYFVCEEEAMRKNSLISGYFCSNRNVVESIKFDTQFCDAFLSGENYYNQMSQTAGRISSGKTTAYDPIIDLAFAECVRDYAFGRKTQEQALIDFTRTVYEAFPELI